MRKAGFALPLGLGRISEPQQARFHSYSGFVLLVADLFHPVNCFAVELFLNGDMRNGSGWRSTMPVLLTGREPYDVTGSNFFDRASPALCAPATGGHDQG